MCIEKSPIIINILIGKIMEKYNELFGEANLTVIQDLFHARERVNKTLKKQSPKFVAARGELFGIMSRFKKKPENGKFKLLSKIKCYLTIDVDFYVPQITTYLYQQSL